MAYGIIYKVTFPNAKSYIGQTTRTLEYRKREHMSRLDSEDYPFHRALKKYGIDNTTWEVIDEAANASELNEKEIYWIFTYKTCTKLNSSECQGYNVDYGGKAHSHFTWLTCEELIQFGEDYRLGLTFEELWDKYKNTNIPRERMLSLYNGRTYTIFTNIPKRNYEEQPKEVVLNKKKIDSILKDFKQFGEFKKVGELNGISEQQVASLVKGDIWSSYTGINNLDFCTKYFRVSKLFTNEEVDLIAQLSREGKKGKEIASILKTDNVAAVYRIANGSNLGWYTGIKHDKILNKYS